MNERINVEKEYEKTNELIIDSLLNREITTREALREMNKNLGNLLVKLSEIKK